MMPWPYRLEGACGAASATTGRDYRARWAGAGDAGRAARLRRRRWWDGCGAKATPRNKRAIGRSLRRPVAAPKSTLMERQFLGVALASRLELFRNKTSGVPFI